MKKIISVLICFVIFSNIKSQQTGDVLSNIQDKINSAFAQSLISKNINPLNQIKSMLYQQRAKKTDNISLFYYWISYADYYESLYYNLNKDSELAEDAIDNAIKRLADTLPNRNSEAHSLLALCQTFSIQFISNPIKIGMLSKKIDARCEKAIELDSANLRPYYVMGELDFYTPAMFGGQKKCEALFLKAITMQEQKIKNPYMPSWGKERAYKLLIELYLAKEEKSKKIEDKQKAIYMYKQAIKEYPNSYEIKELATKLID